MNEREALKLALEALERSVATCFDQYAHQQVMSQPDHFINQTITAIKEVLSQHDSVQAKPEPEQEPVVVTYQEVFEAMQALYNGNFKQQSIAAEMGKTKLYITPPQRKLTDEQKDASRYRWLRDNNAFFTWIPSRYNEKTVSGFSAFGTGYLGFEFEAAVDLAIEAAIKEKNT